MLKAHKDQLRALVADLRHTLDRAWDADDHPVRGDLDRELERMGIAPDGSISPLDALPNPTPADRRAHRMAEAQLGTLPKDTRATVRAEIVERAAYTWINRLLALRTMEARGLIEETLRANPAYEGISEALYLLRYDAPQRTGSADGGWWTVLDDACAAQAQVLPGLFDPDDPNAALRPSVPALLHCLRAVGNPALDAVFQDPDAVSWAYQFYQEEAKSRVYAKLNNGGKVETRAEIAAATQLFTEPYMVQWLLQNSLGRTYHEAHPDSTLPAGWPYYIDREKILTNDRSDDFSRSPHDPTTPPPQTLFPLADLTFLDPCTGSGHFQREAFDMLFAMYREQHPDMDARAVADRILAHHLHGIDIDPRAVQLAALTLVLRAWETVGDGPYTPPALNLAATPAHLDDGALERHLARHPEDEVYRPILAGVFAALAQAPILGSLLKPEEHLDAAIQAFKKQRAGGQFGLLAADDAANRLLAELARHDPAELKRLLLARIARSFAREAAAGDVGAQLLGREAGEGVHLLQLLDRTYAVVATNPPYMGSKNMDAPLRKYVESHYKPGKRDLYAAFILRCLALTRHGGRVAMVTQQSWMFQKSYTALRAVPEEDLAKSKHKNEFSGLLRETCVEGLAHLGPNAFEEISGEVVQSAMFTLAKRIPNSGHQFVTIRVTGVSDAQSKAIALELPIVDTSLVFPVKQVSLLSIDRSPIIYSLNAELIDLLAHGQKLNDITDLRQGVATTEDPRFLRFEWETIDHIRWVQFEKGDGYSRWTSESTYRIDWEGDGARIKTRIDMRPDQFVWTMRMPRSDAFFRKGLTFSVVGRGALGTRVLEDSVFGGKSPFIFTESLNSLGLGAFLNSHFATLLVRNLSQGIEFGEGYVRQIPCPMQILNDALLDALGKYCVHAKQVYCQNGILDRRFTPGTTMQDITAPIAFQLQVEATIEERVLTLLNLGQSIKTIICEETGTSVGWHPLLVGYDSLPDLSRDFDLTPVPDEVFDDLTDHERIIPRPDELARIKANLQTLYAAGPGSKTDDLDLDDLAHHDDEDDGGGSGAYIPIPTETFLEELSVKLQIHPISVYWLLEELRAEGVRCKPEEQRLLEDRLTVLLLRLLGHRWPKQLEAGEPIPAWADRDGVIPLTGQSGEVTLADRLRARLRAEEGDLGAQQTEALLHELTGRTLEEWLRRDFFKRHISQFKKRPIAWHLASDPTAGGRKKSAEPAFECMVYYHATDSDILARIRTQYVDRLLAPARQALAQARRDNDETAAAQANARIQELEEFAQRLRTVEETGFACKDLDASLADEPLDRWSGDGVFPPESRAALYAQEAGWHVDINDGVRVNIAPLQAAGLLASDVLARKDVSKAIADRARWRSDERRWVRAGKLPRCGWMDASVPESPKWTALAPERERERLRLEEKRQKVLAELGN